MDCWMVLGIKPTKDKLAVKDAYTEKLKKTNPEDDPEGFMNLRKAYEEANAYAHKPESAEETKKKFDDSPLGHFMERVDSLYNDFSKRIDLSQWDELFSDDQIVGIDSFHETREAMLVFLLGHCTLPRLVWKKIIDALGLVEDLDELRQKFPPNFLDYCINCSNMPDAVDYSSFSDTSDGKKIDQFIELYVQMTNALYDGDADTAQELYERLEDTGLEHPDLIAARARLLSLQGDDDYSQEILEDGLLDYPDSLSLKFSLTNLYQRKGRYDEALEGYRELEEKYPDATSVKVGLATCYLEMKRYIDCKKLCRKILNGNRFNDYVHGMMIQVNTYLIKDFSKNWTNKTISQEDELELAWCYYQNGELQPAEKVLEGMDGKGIINLDIQYLLGRTKLLMGKYQQAIASLKYWADHFDEFRDEPGEAGDRNRDRQGLTYFFLAEAYIGKEKYDEALATNETGIKNATIDKGMLLNQRGFIYYRCGKYDDALTWYEKAIMEEPQNYEAMVSLGDTYLKQSRYLDALHEYDRAMSINPFDSRANAGKIKVFTIFEEYGEAEKILDELRKEVELTDELLYVESMMLEKSGDKAGAKLNLKELERRFKTEPDHYTDLSEPADVFYEIAVMHYDSKEKDRLKQAAYWLNKGLKLKPRDCDLLFFRGNVYAEQGRLDLAEKFLIKCIKCGGDEELLYYRLGKIFMKADPAKAARYLKITLEKFPENKKARKALRDLTGGKK